MCVEGNTGRGDCSFPALCCFLPLFFFCHSFSFHLIFASSLPLCGHACFSFIFFHQSLSLLPSFPPRLLSFSGDHPSDISCPFFHHSPSSLLFFLHVSRPLVPPSPFFSAAITHLHHQPSSQAKHARKCIHTHTHAHIRLWS